MLETDSLGLPPAAETDSRRSRQFSSRKPLGVPAEGLEVTSRRAGPCASEGPGWSTWAQPKNKTQLFCWLDHPPHLLFLDAVFRFFSS